MVLTHDASLRDKESKLILLFVGEILQLQTNNFGLQIPQILAPEERRLRRQRQTYANVNRQVVHLLGSTEKSLLLGISSSRRIDVISQVFADFLDILDEFRLVREVR